MLANCQNVAERSTNYISVIKERGIDFLDLQAQRDFSQSVEKRIMPNPEVNPPVEIIAG